MKPNVYSFLPLAVIGALAISGSAVAAAPDSSGEIIKADGSSTVYPITEAVAEDFGKQNRGTKITVGISGTGGGFKKFCAGETDISNASRPIKPTEAEACKAKGIEYIELPVAYDALSVVVNPKNTWATTLTVAELKKIWAPEAQGKIMFWDQVRAGFPHEPLTLFGPGVDSGTFDYFTEAINGKEDLSRGDFTSSEDDNILVQGVANDKNALGFFGLAYFNENKSKLKAVAIDDENEANGKGAQLPSDETVQKATYQPLARPLFVYVRKDSLTRDSVKQFVAFYLANASTLSAETGYVSLPTKAYELAQARFNKLTTGSIYAAGTHHVGVALVDLMQRAN